jgi:small subunit ribosomal protein S6
MEKIYEVCFLLKADITEEETEKEVNFIEESIVKDGGKSVKKELWGKKHLAYPIKKKTEAVYYIFYFKASPDIMSHIKSLFKRRDNILRYLFLQKKRLPEEEKKEGDKSRPPENKSNKE